MIKLHVLFLYCFICSFRNLMECLTETQTDPQLSVVTETDDKLFGCEAESEVRTFLLI